MEEEKEVVNKEKYGRVTTRIAYYMKNKNIARIFKEKCPLFAASGFEEIINLFSNSLEHMGYFSGHKEPIQCLCTISNKILASGSRDSTIKIWNIEDRSIMSTLSGHSRRVNALCSVKPGVLVAGYWDDLIIWSQSTPESSTYSHRLISTGHRPYIRGIIRLSNSVIVSGTCTGALMMWDIDQDLCLRRVLPVNGYNDRLFQIKQDIGGDIVASYKNTVRVWGTANNWKEGPIKQFNNLCDGYSIEFLSGDLLLRGGREGQLEFIDYAQGGKLYTTIESLQLGPIRAIQRIAKNIVVTASGDGFNYGYLKVIDPISIKSYLCFKKKNKGFNSVAYFY